MTDVSNLLPNALSVPSEMKLGEMKPSMVASRSYYTSVSPQSSSTSIAPGSTITFRIPAGRRNTFLDPTQSYLRLTVKNNDATNAIVFDGSAYSVINRMTVTHAGNVVDDILNYNVIANYYLNQQLSASEKIGLSSMLGLDTTGTKAGWSIPTSDQYTACLPLLGSIFLGSSKLIPVGLLNDDIQVDLYTETTLKAFYAAAAVSDYTITNVQLNLCYVEISDEAMNQVAATYGQQIYIATETFRSAPITIDSTVSGNYSSLVPARYSSLKALHFIPRSSADQVQASYALVSNVNPNISEFQLRVGNVTTPNRPIQLQNTYVGGFAEGFVNTQRAFHALGMLEINPCYSLSDYNRAQTAITDTPVQARVAAGSGAHANSFTIGFELESVAHKDSVLISGMNTLSAPVFADMTFYAAAGATYEITSVHHIDSILVIENGIMSVRL